MCSTDRTKEDRKVPTEDRLKELAPGAAAAIEESKDESSQNGDSSDG